MTCVKEPFCLNNSPYMHANIFAFYQLKIVNMKITFGDF